MIQVEQTKLSGWKECPSYVHDNKKYTVDRKRPLIATKTGGKNYSTIIGNAPLLPNIINSWNIKLLESKENDGRGTYIGVAPSDIDHNSNKNYNKCGWYFYCYLYKLTSGPPHNYDGKAYGNGRTIQKGDSIGVVMDTMHGDLSFTLNGVNLGIAYESIPLDKPLVPCVLLENVDDTVELSLSDQIENVNDTDPIPSCFKVSSASFDSVTLDWFLVTGAECYQVKADELKSIALTKSSSVTVGKLLPGTVYNFRVRSISKNSTVSVWIDAVKVKTEETLDFSECVWKKCTVFVKDKTKNTADDCIKEKPKYVVNEKNPRIVTCIYHDACDIVGTIPLPLNKVVSWSIKMLSVTHDHNDDNLCIGVSPFDLSRKEWGNSSRCGWYFDCHKSALRSGPPHGFNCEAYGPRKRKGDYVHTGDTVGIIMDTTKGNLSFVVNRINYGVAYKGIPLDKPLAPYVLLEHPGDSVELDLFSEVKENVDDSIPVPSNVIAKGNTWDSITLIWDSVKGASFYQIEIDENKFWYASTTNTFSKGGFPPESEHRLRVRTVVGRSVSEWSDLVKEYTLKESFETCGWKECPSDTDTKTKYIIGGNNGGTATKKGSNFNLSTIIGNTYIPLDEITSWSIKILKSSNNGSGIYIGVSPFDINQNMSEDNYNKCGWYFCCYKSTLISGPPHNYKEKEYGLRKGDGEYVHKKDVVGVVMNTLKGELSFALNGVNCGVAYEGIPLDKPLVPCVILYYKGDSVELDTTEIKENVTKDLSIPSNLTAKSDKWDSITIKWDAVEKATFYQVEVNDKLLPKFVTKNEYTITGLNIATGYDIKVRVMKNNQVSMWSNVVKEFTQKPYFEKCVWKKCPNDVYSGEAYEVDKKNPRIVVKKPTYGNQCYTIIGDTAFHINSTTCFGIKVLKARYNGDGMYFGVVPFDINLTEKDNYENCGWYFYCYKSTLWSGPPHNYKDVEYGPRKGDGNYVHKNNVVGIVMDTLKGELSFALEGNTLDVAYKGIPLDKPLVPCIILRYKDDPVELIVDSGGDEVKTREDCVIS